jgi:uncharacterized protein YcaQ
LKADKATSTLCVKAAHAEPAITVDTSSHVSEALLRMSAWLGLQQVKIDNNGSLAKQLKSALKAHG